MPSSVNSFNPSLDGPKVKALYADSFSTKSTIPYFNLDPLTMVSLTEAEFKFPYTLKTSFNYSTAVVTLRFLMKILVSLTFGAVFYVSNALYLSYLV